MEKEGKLCNQVKTVKEYAYLTIRLSAYGRCAVAARTRYRRVMFMEYGELLYENRFPLWLIGAVYKSCLRLTILYGCKAWCFKEGKMETFLKDREIDSESNVWRELKDRSRPKDLMLLLGLNETMDQLTMANSVHWYGHVLRIEDGHVLRRAIQLAVEGQKKKRRPKKV